MKSLIGKLAIAVGGVALLAALGRGVDRMKPAAPVSSAAPAAPAASRPGASAAASSADAASDWWHQPAASSPLPAPLPPRPHYVLQDGGRYGYEGQASTPLVMLAYNGLRNGAHEFMDLHDSNERTASPPMVTVASWKPGAQFMKVSVYNNGTYSRSEHVRVERHSVLMAAMSDAERGLLERYKHRPKGRPDGIYVYCDEVKGCGSDKK